MAKQTIITDILALHKKSEPADPDSAETLDLLHDLYDSLPPNQMGLAAPQINILKQVFVAWLPAHNRKYGFVNPRFIEKSKSMTLSIEGCLSLPGVMLTVERCAQVSIDADRIVELSEDENGFLIQDVKGPFILNQLEAFVVQHEYDHLEGKLLIDLPIVQTNEEKMQEQEKKRQARIQAKRQARKQSNKAPAPKLGAKKSKSKKQAEKEKRRVRKARKRQQKRIEIEERYNAKREGLFDPSL